jgi:hydrogenase maturation protein HypF
VLLTGGCFQNARLTERTLVLLRDAGHEPYWHHRVPTNDGGLAVGQAAFAAHPLAPETL